MTRAIYLGLSFVPLFASAWIGVQGPAEERDPIARLRGTKLEFEPRQGYLRSVLAALKIDPASQTLVFSKTSRQSDFIGPKTPRALYFNQDTYVGWIPGAPLIEIITVDPVKGAVFYTLRNDLSSPLEFRSETKDCTLCHSRIHARLFASSSPIGPAGYPAVFARAFDATPSLPLSQRWGGWYVSGTHGGQRHMGNSLLSDSDESRVDEEAGANVTDLRRFFDVRPYLTPHSDIVALMAMEAQMDVQNALDRTSARLRAGDDVSEACEPLVRALLGCDEVKLTAPIKGTSEFAAHYAATAPKDAKGRALSELDLKTRLLKYPCSPLIYSASFEALPEAGKGQIGRRLKEILSGKGDESRFEHLTVSARKAVLEILRETKPGLIPSS